MGIPFDRSQRPLRHGEFYAQWRLEQDVLRAARAGGPVAVAVWAALRARAGTRTRLEGPFAPSIGALAKDLDMSDRSVQRCVSDLEAAGMVTVERRPGQKPVWILMAAGVLDPRKSDGGSPAEISEAPPTNLRGTPANLTGDPRKSVTPVPPQESRERRESRNIGDEELRKTERLEEGSQDSNELSDLVREFSGMMFELLAIEPSSQDVAALELLVEDARDVEAWRGLVDQARSVRRLSPHLQEADA
jgi:hypothetical protein